MNRSERLNRIQRYAYRKRNFTLRELMQEFGISRSTALRDIEALETIGLPLYADRGRGGGYRVLETASLPPVSFTNREILALYFAMQTLRGLSDDALRVSFDSIHAKFLEVVSEPQREQIERFRHRIAFYPDEPAEAGACLETLLQAAVRGEVLAIRYAPRSRTRGGDVEHEGSAGEGRDDEGMNVGRTDGIRPAGGAAGSPDERSSGEGLRSGSADGIRPASGRAEEPAEADRQALRPERDASLRRIQPFAVYAARGFWYCRAYDLDKREYRVFRCDRVLSAEVTADEPVEELRAFDLRDAHTLRRPSAEAIAFRCAVAPEAAAQLRRRLYPSMALSEAPETAGRLILAGRYEPQETEFIVSFLASFGSALRVLEPESLRGELRAHYLRLIEAL
ncbi:hypothetical protein CDO73_11980 [Saccharibacillus sp. O23]|uniref:helix-turn-helix transcriptional regulator n=1 Tax=Saccharibacillus sp. O23 TaxID=2009338 RepID=UPI000B4E62F1|nr:WYL domain-containing protein [Saccharibacillus sp. O23]OWR29805.1 hypothetical protein CDO73_11980 [Saccharibacillus sp. O23]